MEKALQWINGQMNITGTLQKNISKWPPHRRKGTQYQLPSGKCN